MKPAARNTSEKFDYGRNFANKLWNIGQFVLGQLPPQVPSVSVDDIPDGVFLLDVREDEEWNKGMIPNARFSTSRPGAMVMLNGADVPTSTARPNRWGCGPTAAVWSSSRSPRRQPKSGTRCRRRSPPISCAR